MSVTILGAAPAFKAKQTVLLYVGSGSETSYPIKLGALAPNTKSELYKTAGLLAQYDANAPTPALKGMYVNYDPASANLDQKKCVGAISGQFVDGVTGVDNTSIDTATLTYNEVNVVLFGVDVKFYENALVLNNTAAQITGFNATFNTQELDTCQANGSATRVLKVIGKV